MRKPLTGDWFLPGIPPIKGSDTQDCFVYRTIEDLNAIESCARRSKRGAVVGGGLLGLEAAGALKNLGIETHAVQFAHADANSLIRRVASSCVAKSKVWACAFTPAKTPLRLCRKVSKRVKPCVLPTAASWKLLYRRTRNRPRDKLATQCGLDVAPRGGIVINDSWPDTSDPDIYAIGECASWNNRVFGLVAPGYKMAQVAVDHILGSENAFEGADLSAKLKLLGVDVGGIGDAHGRTPGARSYVYLDESKEIYKRLIVSEDNKTLLGAVLVLQRLR